MKIHITVSAFTIVKIVLVSSATKVGMDVAIRLAMPHLENLEKVLQCKLGVKNIVNHFEEGRDEQ